MLDDDNEENVHRAVADERRAAADEQRADAAADALSRRRRTGSRSCWRTTARSTPPRRDEAGLVTFAPDEIDWDDEVRLAVEARAAFSPDALTGLEANLRFAGPETMETKIFGRLTRVAELDLPAAERRRRKRRAEGVRQQGRPEFDWKRT